MTQPKALDPLTRLQDAALEDLQSCSDEVLLSEAAEDGLDVAALTSAIRCRVSEIVAAVKHGEEGAREIQARYSCDAEQDEHKRAGERFLKSVLPEGDVEAFAESILVTLSSTCPNRHAYTSNLLDDRYSDMRTQLVERLLSTYLDDSAELEDLFPGSRAQLFRKLLHDAMQDPNISHFANISMGTLASTLCTLALGKASGLEFDSHKSTGQRNRVLRQIRGRKAWRAFHRLVTHQPEMVTDSVDAPRAVTGLAAMQAGLEDYRPDAIIAVAGGGEIVADFLSRQLGMESYRYFVASPKKGGYTLNRDLLEGGGVKRAVIVDDISRTGRTLSCIRHQTLGGIGSVDFKALVLVSAVTATNSVKDFALMLPVVSHSLNVSVPWDNKGSFKMTRTNYIFGAERRREPLEVGKRFYERTYTALRGAGCAAEV